MKEVHAWETSDGCLFNDEQVAKAHEDDLLGKELDGLLNLLDSRGRLARHDRYYGLLDVMKSKRKELKAACTVILRILNHAQV